MYYQNVRFPLKNLPIVELREKTGLRQVLFSQEGDFLASLTGKQSPSYQEVTQLAEQLLAQLNPPIYLCIQQDMAKALGQALAVRLPAEAELLCIDRIKVGEGGYLDIGTPVGGAIPVVIKTLVLSK